MHPKPVYGTPTLNYLHSHFEEQNNA